MQVGQEGRGISRLLSDPLAFDPLSPSYKNQGVIKVRHVVNGTRDKNARAITEVIVWHNWNSKV